MLWKNNIGLPSLPKRQSQPLETFHFLSHYPSHSLRFPPSPLLSPEVSDTETGNNQNSAELMPQKKHRTPDSLYMYQADLFRVVAAAFLLTLQSLTCLSLSPLSHLPEVCHSPWTCTQIKSHCFNLLCFLLLLY